MSKLYFQLSKKVIDRILSKHKNADYLLLIERQVQLRSHHVVITWILSDFQLSFTSIDFNCHSFLDFLVNDLVSCFQVSILVAGFRPLGLIFVPLKGNFCYP